jgi:hypothetical protein
VRAAIVAAMTNTITTAAPPRRIVPGRPPEYVDMAGVALVEPGPVVVEPMFTGIIVECDIEPLVSVTVTV